MPLPAEGWGGGVFYRWWLNFTTNTCCISQCICQIFARGKFLLLSSSHLYFQLCLLILKGTVVPSSVRCFLLCAWFSRGRWHGFIIIVSLWAYGKCLWMTWQLHSRVISLNKSVTYALLTVTEQCVQKFKGPQTVICRHDMNHKRLKMLLSFRSPSWLSERLQCRRLPISARVSNNVNKCENNLL